MGVPGACDVLSVLVSCCNGHCYSYCIGSVPFVCIPVLACTMGVGEECTWGVCLLTTCTSCIGSPSAGVRGSASVEQRKRGVTGCLIVPQPGCYKLYLIFLHKGWLFRSTPRGAKMCQGN